VHVLTNDAGATTQFAVSRWLPLHCWDFVGLAAKGGSDDERGRASFDQPPSLEALHFAAPTLELRRSLF
jgi:hypothetical protein